MKKFAKRFTLAFLAGILMALGAVLGACGGKDPEPSEEQGLYYYDAGTEEYTLELILGNTFTLEMKGKEMTGKYELDGELLTLKVKKGDELSANYYENAVTLTYEEATYRFLKKIDYTVTFQTNGGTAVDAQKVVNGKTVAKPDDPVNGDLVFVGWYTDNNTFRNLFSFTQPITADITLYARFVEKIQPEFTVKFDAGEGATTVDPMTTVGHKLFGLPTPQKAGTKFVGWWMSDYNDAEKLTAQYVEQSIEQPITLYAVWESDAPAVSVSSTGVVWTGRSGNTNYTVTITDPDGNAVVNGLNVGTTSYAYNFANAAEGDYTVSVTMNGQTTTAYYKNKALASVSYFEVEGNTLLFNAVPNATNYLITVVCGTETHTHTDLDLGTKTSFDFSECAMKDGKIVFTVKATAEGYVPSTSRSYECTRTLDAVTGLSFDAEKDVVSWAAVKNAASYLVSVAAGSQVDSKEVLGTEFDLQYYNSGDLSVMVTPKAIGWNSPVAASGNYAKAHLATPANIRLVASTLHWEEVDGAQSYTVSINGQVRSGLTDHTLDLTEYYDPAKTSYEIKVCAIATDTANSSLWAEYTIRNGEMGAVEYERGTVKWDAVFGAQSYRVKLNDSKETTPVEDGATSYAITFTQEGENTISVCAVNADGTTSDWKTVTVTVYSIKFDAQNGENRPTLYKAKGDPLTLSETTRYGYTFSGWYTEPNGEGDPFTAETFDFEYNRTVYAKWTPNKYWVSFEVGAYGEAVDRQEVTFGELLHLPTPKANKDNVTYAFSGWYDNSNTQYTDFTGTGTGTYGTYLVASDMTLRAQWVAIFEFERNEKTQTYTVSKGEGIRYVEEVTIPATYTDGENTGKVTIVADFTNTPTLKKINIPNSIETLTLGSDSIVFLQCDNLSEINIYESDLECDQVYYSDEGVLFRWNATTKNMELVYYPYGRTEETYAIPGTIKTQEGAMSVNIIKQGAFHAPSSIKSSLKTLQVPATVSLFEAGAFYNFGDLNSIDFLPLKEGETQANDLVFMENVFGDPEGEGSSSLKPPIRYIKLPNYIKTDPSKALKDLSLLGYIDVEPGGIYTSVDGLLCTEDEAYGGYRLVLYPRYRSVDDEGTVLKGTSGSVARTFRVPDEIHSIGKGAVKNAVYLYEVIIPRGVRYIGENAFEGAYNIETITFEGTADDLPLEIATKAFLGEYTNPEKVDPDHEYEKLPDYYNTKMKELHLPANLTKIGANAFGEIRNLKTVYVDLDGTKFTDNIEYAKGAFDGVRPGNVFSPSQVTTVYFTQNVPYLEVRNIFGAALETLNIPESNPNYYRDDRGIVYNADVTDLVFFPDNFEGEYELPEKLTKIQSGMFQDVLGLSAITIPAKVTEIADKAFMGCKNLAKVIFEPAADGATRDNLIIGESAFAGCVKLNGVELPEGLTSLGHRAFGECESLTSITLPASLVTLQTSSVLGDMEVFADCDNLKEINIAEGNTHFKFDGGVLYTLREAKLDPEDPEATNVPDQVIYVTTAVQEEIEVSEYISGVGCLAFTRSSQTESKKLGIKTITFKDHVDTYDPETGAVQFTSINFNPHLGNTALSPFYYLTSLQEIRFPVGMETMPKGILTGCSNLTKVNVPYTVESIEVQAFSSCSKLTTLTFDETPEGVEAKGLRIEDGVQSGVGGSGGAPSYSSVFGSTSITSLEFPARDIYIGDHAFTYESGGTSPTTTSTIQTVKFKAGKSQTKVTLAAKAFYSTKNLISVEFEDGVAVEFGESCFASSGLSSINIPEGTTKIGNSAFSSCTKLTSIEFPKTLEEIGNSAFSSTKLESLTLAEGLKTIGNSAFNGLKTLTGTLSIPSTVTSIGSSAFTGTGYSKVTTAQDNKLATIGDNAFSSMTALEGVEFGKTATPLTFGQSVFAGCTALASFEFPQNVKAIGASIFANLAGLTEVTFAVDEQNKNILESIGATAFSKTGISEISIPDSSAQNGIALGVNLFKSCTALETVKLSASVFSIDGVFSGCASIKQITIAAENTHLKSHATLPLIYSLDSNGKESAIMLVYGELSGNNTRFEIASGTEIGQAAFANQTQLEYVFIPASVVKIGANAFQNCINLKTVEIASGSALTEIGVGAFQNCVKLESINLEVATQLKTLADGVKTTAYYSIDGTTYPLYSTTGIFANAGTQSENPLKITFPTTATLEKLGKYMFAQSGAVEIDLSGLSKLTQLPTGETYSSYGGKYMGLFSDCTKLTTIKLPTSVTFLGTDTFAGCTALTRIYTGQAEDAVAEGTFDFTGLTNLKYIDSSNKTSKPSSGSISQIYLFTYCTLVETIKFPTSLVSFGAGMFKIYGTSLEQIQTITCPKLTSITGLENLEVIGQYAFNGSKITTVDFTTQLSKLDTIASKAFAGLGITNADLSKLENLTKIPDNLFQYCDKLTSVTFPSSIASTGIGTKPFDGCTNLQTVDMSAATSLASLANNLFLNCTNLETVKLPISLNYLGTNTFQGCTALTRIYTGQTEVAEGTFDLSGLTSLTCIGTSKTAAGASANSYLFDGCTAVTKVILPASCTKLAGYVFSNCTSLEANNVNLEKVTQIGKYCFMNTGTTTFAFPASVTEYGDYVFQGCEKLTTIDTSALIVAGAITLGKGGSYMFQNCTGLKVVDLSGLTALTLLPNYMFDGCTELTWVKLPASEKLTHLGTYTFRGCTNLSKITTGQVGEEGTFDFSGLTKLIRFSSSATTSVNSYSGDTHLFEGCAALKKLILPEDFAQIGGFTFKDSGLEEIDLAGITTIGQSAFNGSKLKSVTIPATVQYIYTGAFANCEDLATVTFENNSSDSKALTLSAGSTSFTSSSRALGLFENSGIVTLTLGDRITSLPNCTFRGCADLTTMTLPENLTTVGSYVFDGCENLANVDFTHVTNLGDAAFANTGLTGTVTLPATLATIGADPFAGCESVTAFDVDGDSEALVAIEGILARTDGTIVSVPGGYTFVNGEFDFNQLPDGVTVQFVANMFSEIKGLTKVILPENMDTLPASLFAGSAVTEVVLPLNLTAIPDHMFDGSAITNITIPATVTSIGQYAFANTEALTAITIPASVTSIGQYAFANTAALATITIPEDANLESIGNYAFNSSAITAITIPASVTSIGTNAFANTAALTTATFLNAAEGTEEQPLTISAGGTTATGTTGLFFGSAVETVLLPKRLEVLPSAIFMNTANLASVTLPQNITAISVCAFYNSGIESVVIPEGVTEIGNYAFYNTKVTGLLLPESATKIGNYAYAYTPITELAEEDFKNVTDIGTNAFIYSKVVHVVIPGTVATLGSYAFEYCDELLTFELKDAAEGVTRAITITQHFRYCTKIQSIILGEGVTTISSFFYDDGSTTLTEVVLPDSLTTLQSSAFANCTALKKIVFGKDSQLSSIAASTFATWNEDQMICFENSAFYVGGLVGLDWMFATKANVVFNYTPSAAEAQA